jgi:hypothetical protein
MVGIVHIAVVVARDRLDLYEALRRDFVDTTRLAIVLDRRRGERRRESQPVGDERRKGDRRRHSIDDKLSSLGWAFVKDVSAAAPRPKQAAR